MASQVTLKSSSWSLPKFPTIPRSIVASAAVFAISLLALSQFQMTESSFNLANVCLSAGAGLATAAFTTERTVTNRPSPEPTTSGYLRWMNIWLDADQRGLTGAGKNVAIFGPGRWETEFDVHCPQLAEACKMFNGSKITVYDSNPKVLTATAQMDHRLAQRFLRQTFDRNERFVEADNFQKVQDQLCGEIEPVCSVVQKNFRMGKDAPSRKSADVILATFSLLYPLVELAKRGQTEEQKIEFFSQYLAHLKPGGSLYIEQDSIWAILGDSENVGKAMQKDPAAQRNVQKLTEGDRWMHRFKERLSAHGINVEICRLPQALGCGGFLCSGIVQITQRLTQAADVFVFIRK